MQLPSATHSFFYIDNRAINNKVTTLFSYECLPFASVQQPAGVGWWEGWPTPSAPLPPRISLHLTERDVCTFKDMLQPKRQLQTMEDTGDTC